MDSDRKSILPFLILWQHLLFFQLKKALTNGSVIVYFCIRSILVCFSLFVCFKVQQINFVKCSEYVNGITLQPNHFPESEASV